MESNQFSTSKHLRSNMIRMQSLSLSLYFLLDLSSCKFCFLSEMGGTVEPGLIILSVETSGALSMLLTL